jgi:hypothetical protein
MILKEIRLKIAVFSKGKSLKLLFLHYKKIDTKNLVKIRKYKALQGILSKYA